ncbi:tellurite resistance TerB family protein [Stieleria sp. TO1_6]|uniref:tellurite resistance TerB family protein n=1 Tax=Stieleria tagensis TaxID=2956795 RepID=UPI00209A776F|nr:DUF533 domain-containing protein [Stieleria tagensis]MCO8124466.1 tellurite resistance TerB family protein [Stieleria tagensis]
MDITDILGSLLGSQTRRGGKGGDALNDIFKRRSSPAKPSGSTSTAPTDIDRQAKELEDILNVAKDRNSGSPAPTTTSTRSPSAPASRSSQSGAGQSSVDQERATILVRAMVNAAKADGQIDQTEQQNIIKQLHNPSREALQFLQDEFDRPLDVRGFAMSVPVGMEQQVYTMSLIAINLDTGAEAKYLKELGDTLRLSQEVREQIHQRMGAPSVY